jgi:hypothetical protein
MDQGYGSPRPPLERIKNHLIKDQHSVGSKLQSGAVTKTDQDGGFTGCNNVLAKKNFIGLGNPSLWLPGKRTANIPYDFLCMSNVDRLGRFVRGVASNRHDTGKAKDHNKPHE